MDIPSFDATDGEKALLVRAFHFPGESNTTSNHEPKIIFVTLIVACFTFALRLYSGEAYPRWTKRDVYPSLASGQRLWGAGAKFSV